MIESAETPGGGAAGRASRPEWRRSPLRVSVLAALFLAPLAFGAVHEPAWIPLVVLAAAAGAWSRWQARRRRRRGAWEPKLPGGRLLVAYHVLIALQLVPLPPGVLRRLSPGSFAVYEQAALLPLRAWRPISVSPPDTLRGLVLLAGMSLLYAAVFREFRDPAWRRRLAGVVVAAGFVATVVAFVQAAAGQTRIYGLWRPPDDWAVFGPWVNRNHFADYMAMAIPLAVALAVDALAELRRSWSRRRLLALGEAAGNAAARRLAVVITLVAGLLGSQSRGGFVAFVVSAALLPLAFPTRRRTAAAVLVTAALLGVWWVGVQGIVTGFEVRGVRASRLDLWIDAVRMVPDFPVLGAGFNAFGTAYLPYQNFWRSEWVGQVHDEYLQALLDTGVVGAGIMLGLLFILFRRAVEGARASSFSAAVLCSVLAQCVHNLVNPNWQIPANAATFAALAALAVQPLAAGTPPARCAADTDAVREKRVEASAEATRRERAAAREWA